MEHEVYNEGFGKSANNALNKMADIAVSTIKKPGEGATDSVYEKYNRQVNRVRVAVKTGGILAMGLVVIKPFDVVLQAAIISELMNSNDAADKTVTDIINKGKETIIEKIPGAKNVSHSCQKLRTKIKEFKDKITRKELTEEQAEKQFKLLDTLATSVSKGVDNVRKHKYKLAQNDKNKQYSVKDRPRVKTKAVVAESVEDFYESANVLLTDSDGSIPMTSYEAVRRFADNVNIEDERSVYFLEACIEILSHDCGL